MPSTVILEYFVETPEEQGVQWFLEQIFHVVKYEKTYNGYSFKRYKDPRNAAKPPSVLGLQGILAKHIPEGAEVKIVNIDWFNNPKEDINNMNWLRHKVT